MTINGPLIIVIAGPTAVGKTSLAVSLASHFNTEIISADSRQFFYEMTIGTAVPSVLELSLVKHHFIHHLSIHETYNVSRFELDSMVILDGLFNRHKIGFMVGGSGLYINAVCHGIDQLPDPDPEIRRRLKEILTNSGIAPLQNELERLDPEYAMQVDRFNPARLMRALEVCIATGVPYSALRSAMPKRRNFNILKIGIELPRELLYQRINDRVDAMMQAGLFEEARPLFPFRHLNALNTLGYKELFDHFSGLTSLEYAIEKIKTNSRRYAKRQLTWFKKDPAYQWFRPEETEQILDFISRHEAKS
ncbi:MAG: tRNA (adenosine(37)-N6)-dimethylallyltransferase MiaA [Bacteroidales bacterium]|nr:tRNA (adenosine(37)-N6)-dimethylallyltransferase MiaA [Bacteroidales bacterium]